MGNCIFFKKQKNNQLNKSNSEPPSTSNPTPIQPSFQKQQQSSGNQPKSQIMELFEKLTEGNNKMSDEQLFTFLSQHLQIGDKDPVTGFILVKAMKVEKIQNITYEHFKNLFDYCSVSSLSGVKNSLENMRKNINVKQTQTAIYQDLFKLYCGDKTTIDLQLAGMLWQIYLQGILKWNKQLIFYIDSLEDKDSTKIHKDLWNMMLQFSYDVRQLNKYDENDGWPLFIDNFIEFLQKESNNKS